MKKAIHLYTDDLLTVVYDEWLVSIRQNLRAQLSTALHRSALLLETLGDLRTAIGSAERLVAQDATAESSYQLLMRLHTADGDRASTVRVYHQCKGILRRELGDAASDPSFVSGHCIVAWSSAAVLASEYSKPWQQIGLYTLASGVSLTRVLGRDHFPTDALLGSVSGWLIGRYVYRAHHSGVSR